MLERRREGSEALVTVDREAEAVALDESGDVVALGTCRWRARPADVSEVNELRRIAATIAPGRPVPIVVYTRSGVGARITAEAAFAPGRIEVAAAFAPGQIEVAAAFAPGRIEVERADDVEGR